MPTLPTNDQILAADFSGNTLASLFAIARDYDEEIGGACEGRIEGALARLVREGYTVRSVALVSGQGTAIVPEVAGWRVSGATQGRKFREILVESTRDGVSFDLVATQVVETATRQYGGFDRGFARTDIAAPVAR